MTKEMKNKIKELDSDKRMYGLDILRIIAVCFVLIVHFFHRTYFEDVEIVGLNLIFQRSINLIGLSCVPLFIMLTGYLNKHTKYNKEFFKKLLNIIIIWLFYSICEYIILRIYRGTIQDTNIYDFIYAITSFSGCGYSWYIEMYIGLYCFAPIINNAFDSFSDKDKKVMIILTFFTFIFPGIWNKLLGNVVHFPNYWDEFYFISYYIFGKYISYKKPKLKKISIILILTLMEICLYFYANKYSVNYSCIFIFIQTILIFLFFYDARVKSLFFKKVLKNIFNLSLDIYLASSLVDRLVYPEILKHYEATIIGQQKVFYTFPIVFIIVFVSSYIIGNIRKFLIKVR